MKKFRFAILGAGHIARQFYVAVICELIESI